MGYSWSIKSGAGAAAIAASYKTIISAIASANSRILLYEMLFGTIGTPADQVLQFSVDNESAMTAGTNNTTVTPTPQDPGPGTPPSPLTTAGGAWTTEPTVGTNFFEAGCNMRQMVRWVAKDGKELVAPATANHGIGLRILSPTYTGDVRATLFYTES